MTTACAAGVDVGRDYFDVGLAPSGRTFRVDNGPSGIKSLVDRLRRADVERVVLESIGSYGARLVRGLADAGFEVGVVDDFAQLGRPHWAGRPLDHPDRHAGPSGNFSSAPASTRICCPVT